MQRPDSLAPAEVIRLLRNKVARNPGDLEAGLMLGSALYQAGDAGGSATALRSVLKHHPRHYQALLLLTRAEAGAGDVTAALKTLEHAQRVDPENLQAWQLAVALAAESRNWAALLRIGSDWTRVQPGLPEAWQALSRAHFEESRFQSAISAFDQVLRIQPDQAAHLVSAARLCIAAQHYDRAHEYLTAAQAMAPDLPDLHYTLGRLHHMRGELDAAQTCYRRAIAAQPGLATAYVELGTLCGGKLADQELQAVHRLFTDRNVHPEYRVMLGFTLGDAVDRRGDTHNAFAAWEAANTLNRKLSEQEGFVYRPDLVENEPELLAGLFAEPLDVDLPPLPAAGPQPIFVVGMPRSGTTLVESILAAHTDVYGAGELPTLYDIMESLLAEAREQGIDAARQTLQAEAAAWRQRYLDALPAIGEASRVVDKQPMNFRAIGLIRLLFPDSPIVYTRRAPMDVGLSIYRHKFAKNWPCAHSLGDIGHFYGVHRRLVDFWLTRHGQSVLIVDHGELVRDPQTVISQLLAFAGLSAQPACFTPHQTSRPIATFSSAQVRQPISTAFSGQAQRYSEQLAPLREALVQSGTDPQGELSSRSPNE